MVVCPSKQAVGCGLKTDLETELQLLSALYSSIYYTSAEKNRVKIEIEAGLGVPDVCLPLFAVIGFISAILASGFSLKQTALSKTHFNGCLLFFFPTPLLSETM